ncbi:MAG: hypothetical protein R3C56_19040 [Pirellulaceae bacterium]
MAKPALEIRRGLIKVRVWQRRSKNGVRYSLTVVRLFRNGDQWKESTRLGRDDIPLVRLLLDQRTLGFSTMMANCDECRW